MDNNDKIELLKEHARNDRYNKEPIAHALISILVKKGVITHEESIQIQKEFDEYINEQVDIFFNDLNRTYNPLDLDN